MNIYSVAFTAHKDGELVIRARLYFAQHHEDIERLAYADSATIFPPEQGYTNISVGWGEYNLLDTLREIEERITINGVSVKEKCLADGLTLATLCDMVLGERAENRSNFALIRAIGKLIRERKCPALDKGD